MCTYHGHVNLTLSLDEQTVQKARVAAKAAGKSLNQMIREYLQELAGSADVEQTIAELRRLRELAGGNSQGVKIRREDAYDRKVFS